MFPFIISFIVACVIQRTWLPRVGTWMAIIFGVLGVLSASGQLKRPAFGDQYSLYVWLAGGLVVVEVIAAFLLAWVIRRLLFRSRNKGNK